MPDATPTPQPAVKVENRPAAPGRLSLKAMLLSLLFIALGVASVLFYMLVGPILSQERFIRMLEGRGAKIERRTNPPEEISDWVRKQLGFPAAAGEYEGPLAWDRDDDDLAGKTFRRLTSFREIPPGQKKSGSVLVQAFLSMSALHIVSELEDDRLRWLGSLQNIGDLDLNARKLSGEFLTLLNRTNLDTLTLRGASTHGAWAQGLRAFGRLSTLSIADSTLDPDTVGVIFGMDTLKSLSLENTQIQWPAALDVSRSPIKEVFLTKMKKDRRMMGVLGRLPAHHSLLIWDTLIEPGHFDGLEDAKFGPVSLAIIKGRVHGDALASLRGNQSIRKVFIKDADLDPASIQGLAVLPALESLRIGGPDVNDRVVAHVLKIPPPEHLSFDSSVLTDAGFEELIRLGKFQSLDIASTKVTARGLEALLEPRPLKELSLDSEMLTPSLKERIRKANPQLKLVIDGDSDEEEKEAEP